MFIAARYKLSTVRARRREMGDGVGDEARGEGVEVGEQPRRGRRRPGEGELEAKEGRWGGQREVSAGRERRRPKKGKEGGNGG
eukprot:2905111-Rhodomonas_salina.1